MIEVHNRKDLRVAEVADMLNGKDAPGDVVLSDSCCRMRQTRQRGVFDIGGGRPKAMSWRRGVAGA